MSPFEKQKRGFQEFCENLQDRFDLILQDGIQIVFNESSLILNNKIMIRYSLEALVPEVLLLDGLKTPAEIDLMKNVMNNYPEICDYLKHYITLFNHLSDFKMQGATDDEIFQAACKSIQNMIDLNEIHGQKFFVKTTGDNNDIQVFLEVENYGSSHKLMVDMCYLIIDPENGETRISHYQIDKREFVEDVAGQLSTQKCTHLQ